MNTTVRGTRNRFPLFSVTYFTSGPLHFMSSFPMHVHISIIHMYVTYYSQSVWKKKVCVRFWAWVRVLKTYYTHWWIGSIKYWLMEADMLKLFFFTVFGFLQWPKSTFSPRVVKASTSALRVLKATIILLSSFTWNQQIEGWFFVRGKNWNTQGKKKIGAEGTEWSPWCMMRVHWPVSNNPAPSQKFHKVGNI